MNLKMKYAVVAGAALVGAGFFGGALVAQDHKGHEGHNHAMGEHQAPDMNAMMEAFMKASTPGEQHAKMMQGVGMWDNTIKHWMDPSSPPDVSQGTYEIKSIMDGRYTLEKANSVMMGMPFEGMAIGGYDNVAGHYFSVWFDNFGTGVIVLTGDYNDKGQLVLEGEMSDPTSPSGKSWMREVITHQGANRTTMDMYSKMDGQIIKVMEIKGVRKH